MRSLDFGVEMDTRYYREFIMLAERLNFQESADLLHMSQSSLSKHIQNMEAELGQNLFIRNSRKVRLTKSGIIVLDYAKKIVALQHNYMNELLALETECVEVRVGTIPALPEYRITDILVNYKKEHPLFKVSVTQDTSQNLKEMLANHELDLAFIREKEPPDKIKDNFTRISYVEDSLVAILPKSHALADLDCVPLEALAREKFMFVPPPSFVYQHCMEACLASGFEPDVIYIDHKLQSIIELVKKDFGISLLFDSLANFHMKSEVVVKKITPSAPSYVNICHLKNHRLHIAVKHFIQHAQNTYEL